MKLPEFIRRPLARWAIDNILASDREPDFTIEGEGGAYLHRWWIIPRNPVLNVYLHWILRDDDDRALHDHPWCNITLLLWGGYDEVVFRDPELGPLGGYTGRRRRQGDIIARTGSVAHRLQTHTHSPAITLFITGPTYRHWGFWTIGGWLRHDIYLAETRTE